MSEHSRKGYWGTDAIGTISKQLKSELPGLKGFSEENIKLMRPLFDKAYKHELINNLFFHPYTKIEYMQHDMMVQRKTAAKYLDKIVETGLLEKVRKGRENYYINVKLCNLFLNYSKSSEPEDNTIDSVVK